MSAAAAFWQRWTKHDILQRAAALAYVALFAMVPILLLQTAVAARFLGAGPARAVIYARIADVAGAGPANQALRLVDATNRDASWLAIAIGSAVALLGGVAIVVQFEAAMDVIWDEPERPGGIAAAIRQRLIAALALVVALAGFLVLAAADEVLSHLHVLAGAPAHVLAIPGAVVCIFDDEKDEAGSNEPD